MDSGKTDKSVVTITLDPTPTGCGLKLVYKLAPKWEDHKDQTREGWCSMREKLKGIKL